MNIANAYWARKALELRELLSKFIGFTFETHDLVQKPVHIGILFSGCVNSVFYRSVLGAFVKILVCVFVFVDGHQVKSFVLFVPQFINLLCGFCGPLTLMKVTEASRENVETSVCEPSLSVIFSKCQRVMLSTFSPQIT